MPTTIARRSDDDRQGPPRLSPFRSEDEGIRFAAAWTMIAKRQQELADLEKIKPSSPQERSALRLRIKGTKASLQSWKDYIADGCPQEKRAVVQPIPSRKRVAKVA